MMKRLQKPPFQQKALAIGFTLGVHVIAVVGLLYLGMSQPPAPPKQIRTVLIKPEDLPPVTREETEFAETAHENVAAEIQQTATPVEDAPVIPVAPPPLPQPEPAKAQPSNTAAQQQAEQQKRLEARAQAEAEKLQAQQAQRAKAEAERKAQAAEKAKATAQAKAEAEAKRRSEAEALRKTEAAE